MLLFSVGKLMKISIMSSSKGPVNQQSNGGEVMCRTAQTNWLKWQSPRIYLK